MWLILAGLSACLTGGVAIVVKHGMKSIERQSALFIRSFTVLAVSCAFLLFDKSVLSAGNISARALLCTALSGAALCLSWLAYYRAMGQGSVSTVSSLERLSVPFTVLLSFVILGEDLTVLKALAVVLVLLGIYLSVSQKGQRIRFEKGGALFFGICSAGLGALSVVLSKLALGSLSGMAGLTLRTLVVALITLVIVARRTAFDDIARAPRSQIFFALVTGLCAAIAWVCYFEALDRADAGLVQPFEKLGIWVSVLVSRFVFGEKLGARQVIGLTVMSIGILLPIAYEIRNIF